METNATNASVKFALTITIEGTSLHEIDDALSREAAKRLIARLQNPPAVAGMAITPKVVNEMSEATALTPEVVREMSKATSLTATEIQKRNAKLSGKKEKAEIKAAVAAPTDVQNASAVSEAPIAAFPSEAEVMEVITKLASKKNVDVVRDCMKAVGAAKRTEIKPEDREKFIAACQAAMI